jgi:hypothetical protein
MKIYGSLTVPNLAWRHTYNSILTFFNEEIKNSFIRASQFHVANLDSDKTVDEITELFDEYSVTNKLSPYQDYLIRSSLFNGGNFCKPKRSNFTPYTNRIIYIYAVGVKLNIDKDNHSITLETSEFDDFDKYMASNGFITEFTTMVNSINWPTRTGPSKTVRGCTLVKEDARSNRTLYYQVGPYPPVMDYSSDETLPEPAHLSSTMLRNIKVSSVTPDPMLQPLPQPEDLSEV